MPTVASIASRYALLVHDGLLDFADVPVAAEAFNNPVALFGTPAPQAVGRPSSTFSFAATEARNVTIETVKKAEKSDDIIVRLYEHANQRAGPGSLSACRSPAPSWST